MTKFSVTTSWFGCWVKDNGSVVETICRVGSDHPSVAASLLGVSDEREAVDQAISNGWVRIGAEYAHGFYALQDTVFEYVCDGGYDEASEQAFSIADRLPALLGVETVILSEKDRAAPPLATAGAGR